MKNRLVQEKDQQIGEKDQQIHWKHQIQKKDPSDWEDSDEFGSAFSHIDDDDQLIKDSTQLGYMFSLMHKKADDVKWVLLPGK